MKKSEVGNDQSKSKQNSGNFISTDIESECYSHDENGQHENVNDVPVVIDVFPKSLDSVGIPNL